MGKFHVKFLKIETGLISEMSLNISPVSTKSKKYHVGHLQWGPVEYSQSLSSLIPTRAFLIQMRVVLWECKGNISLPAQQSWCQRYLFPRISDMGGKHTLMMMWDGTLATWIGNESHASKYTSKPSLPPETPPHPTPPNPIPPHLGLLSNFEQQTISLWFSRITNRNCLTLMEFSIWNYSTTCSLRSRGHLLWMTPHVFLCGLPPPMWPAFLSKPTQWSLPPKWWMG